MKCKLLALTVCAALLLGGCVPVSEQAPDEERSDTAQAEYDYDEKFISPVYSALSDSEKELYDKVVDAVVKFEDHVSFDEPVTRDTARKIYRLVYAQERRYFWLSSIFYAPDDELSSLQLKYIYEKDDAERKSTELDEAASAILEEIPENASDFEKAVYFHDTIVTGCTFSKEREHVHSAYGVLVDGHAQCEGYAAAMSLLCDKAGIPNYMVCGTNEFGETHAWNRLVIGGSWYNIDCTRDDPIMQHDAPDFLRHDYCFLSDSEINGITHFPDEIYEGLPLCTATENNYFAGAGLLYDTAADAAESMREQITEAAVAGKREAELRLSNDSAYFAALSRFFDSGEVKRIINDVNGSFGTDIRSAYKYTNDELYVIHVSLIYATDSYEDI